MPWSSDIYTLLNACMGTSILTYIKLSSQYSNSRHMVMFMTEGVDSLEENLKP